MTEQAQGQAAPEAAETQVEAQPQVPDGYVPQKDVSKIAAREKREGKTSRDAEILEKTGAESIDDVLSAYEEYQGIQEAVTTEADRANQRAEKFEARAKEAEERYTSTLRQFAARDALRDAGINPERLKGALRLADLDSLEVDAEGNVTGLEGLVEAVKEESPEWFSDNQERPIRRSPEATRQSVPQNNSYEGQMGGFLNSLLNSPPG